MIRTIKSNIKPRFFSLKYSPVKEYDDSLEIILAQAIVDTIRQENIDSLKDLQQALTSKLQSYEENNGFDVLLGSEQYLTNLYAYYAQNNPSVRGEKNLRTITRKVTLAASAIVGLSVSKKIHDTGIWLKHFYIEHFKDHDDGFSKTVERVPGVGQFLADKYEDTKRSLDHTGTTLSDWFDFFAHWKAALLGVGMAIGFTYGAFKLHDIYAMNRFEHDVVQQGIELYRELTNQPSD